MNMASPLLFLTLLSQLPSLVAAKSIWSDIPGTWDNQQFIWTALPLGNGRLGGMPMSLNVPRARIADEGVGFQ
jgi:hypothetical protein